MKSADFGWSELMCHPDRTSASTSSRLVAPGLSGSLSLNAPIVTTSEGFGSSWESCAFAACGHGSAAASASAKMTAAITREKHAAESECLHTDLGSFQ